MQGSIDYVSDGERLKWNFSVKDFTLHDFDFFERLTFPLKSKVEFQSSGSGEKNKFDSVTNAKLSDSQIKGELIAGHILAHGCEVRGRLAVQ